MPKVRVNGVTLAYTDSRTKPHHEGDAPIVLIHGFPYSKAMWDEQVRELSEEFQVITYDLRGHGESQATPGPYTMELLADDLKGLLDTLHIQKVTLGGFSMGGYVALAFYRKYPEWVGALLLLDTRPQADSEQAKQGRENLAQQVEREGNRGLAESLPARMLTQATASQRPEIVAKARDMILAASPLGIAGAARGMALRRDQSDLLPQIKVPTLVLVGDQDAVTPPADAELMASRISGAQLVKIPGASHLSNLERPEEFSHAIHDFLHPH
ncbi:MAG: alpha/beta fold hydrolase [Chloroflexi bacterium]|nr:alpha/beta fold hydrolase [Chloroflexota bacterium]